MRDLQGSRGVTGNQIITQATVVVKRLQTPEGMLALIELYVGSVAFLLLFLAAFGSLRRRNNNPMLKVVLWAAYTLSGYLITYTLGLMRESPFRNPLFPLWATFLMIFLGSSNSFSAYSLEDNEQWKNYAWQHLVTFIGLLTLWTLYLTTMPSRLAVFLLYFALLVLKTTERALSLVPVSAFGRHRIIKWVADHMSSEHRCLDPRDVDPITMNGYKYVVKMSRTLLEKIFGEVGAPKPNSNMVSEDYEEEVITIEKLKVVELLCLIMGTMLTVVFLMPKTTKPQGIFVQLVTSDGLSIDVLMTAVVLLVFICVELVQLFLMAISDWAKLRWLCNYVKKEWWHGNKPMEKLIGLICRVRLKPWERKLRQYSFLESYNYVPSRLLYNFCTINFIDVVRRGQKQGAPVELSNDVKKAVFHSLKNSNGKLENGQASLRLNNVSDELSWACKHETQTHVIMVWHIATSFLEHKQPSNQDPNFHVATNLSKYIAYLVAFAPRLLPDHLYVAENVFDQITLEAREVLAGCKTVQEKINRLKDIAKEPDNTVMNLGRSVGGSVAGKWTRSAFGRSWPSFGPN
ncbi:hypothetical protein NL676_011909 [Syzygium grande]|nr:hypothetical protein NL676_011909 [Syzygium grande]